MGCGAGKGKEDAIDPADPAPYLTQFYKMVSRELDEVLPTEDKAIKKLVESGAEDEMAKKKLKMEEKIAKDGKPILEKSFNHHDTKQTGVLDKEEAAVFFKHVVEKQAPLMENTTKQMLVFSIKVALVAMKEMFGGELPAEIKQKVEADVESKVEDMKTVIRELVEDYDKNKEELNAAAFKVMDTNGDGTLQKTEFLAAMMPGGAKNQEFLGALGFNEQVIQARVEEKMRPPGQQQDCPVQ